MMFKKILLLSLSVFCLFSCADYLAENQKGVYSEDNFYDSEENALNALLYAYYPHQLVEYAERFQFNLFDTPTDEMVDYDEKIETNLYTWDVTPLTEEFTYFFKYLYICINRANSVYENVGRMPSSIISAKSKDQIMGEALFLRAYNYFMAVRTFGSVPLHASMIVSPTEGKIKNASIETLYGQIISDFDKAIEMMKIQKIQGRADKVTAQAVLSKVYLTLASSKMTGAPGYEWVPDAEKMYGKAAEIAGKVLFEQDIYKLEPELWKVYNVDHEDSPEHLWVSEHSRDKNSINMPMMFGNDIKGKYINKHIGQTVDGSTDVQPYIDVNLNPGGWAYYRPSPQFYKSYQTGDIRRELLCTNIYDKSGNILVQWKEDNHKSSDPLKKKFFFPMLIKYSDPHCVGFDTSAELYYERFAEVMLTYAEAVGPTKQGYKVLNDVRARAGLEPIPAGLSIQDFRKVVWRELEFELAYEGKCLLELRRTNRVEEKIKKPKVRREILHKYAYFYPIPQREADLNPQN